MARQDALHVTVRERIRAEADALADKYQLDPERVYAILERTVGDSFGPLPDGLDTVISDDPVYFPYAPPLVAALHSLPAEDALTLFEQTDLDVILARSDLFAALLRYGPFLPLYTLDELAEVLAGFIAHLRGERAAYLKTGLPRRPCTSGWLSWLLTSLYPTRQFDTLQPGRPHVWHPEPPYSPRWPKRRRWRHTRPASVGYQYDFTWLEPYDAAPLLEGLVPEDAVRLDAGRPTLFELAIAVLNTVLTAVRARSPTTLWPACLRLLTDALTAEEADFYLRMDRSWQGADAQQTAFDVARGDPNGGLAGLLMVIGDCEEALTVSSFAHLRAALKRSAAFAWLDNPRRPFGDYWAIRNPWERRQVDAAFDAFLARQPEVAAFWDDYRRRVNHALEHKFSVMVRFVVEERVPRPVAHKFEPAVRTHADLTRLYLEATGDAPPLPLVRPGPADAAMDNVFRKEEGEYWTIRYQGAEFRLQDSKGLRYIAALLCRPRQEIHVQALVELVEQPQGRLAPAKYRDMTAEQLAEEGLPPSRPQDAAAWATIDDQTRADLQAHLEQLARDIAEARQENDPIREAEARGEFDAITAYLTAGTGLRGAPRTFTTADDRARVNVTKLIKAAKQRIGKHSPALKRHLDACINTGFFCSYTPDPDAPIAWNV